MFVLKIILGILLFLVVSYIFGSGVKNTGNKSVAYKKVNMEGATKFREEDRELSQMSLEEILREDVRKHYSRRSEGLYVSLANRNHDELLESERFYDNNNSDNDYDKDGVDDNLYMHLNDDNHMHY